MCDNDLYIDQIMEYQPERNPDSRSAKSIRDSLAHDHPGKLPPLHADCTHCTILPDLPGYISLHILKDDMVIPMLMDHGCSFAIPSQISQYPVRYTQNPVCGLRNAGAVGDHDNRLFIFP